MQRPVFGFNTLPSGHSFISGFCFFIRFSFFMQRPVLGFNTLPSGHVLSTLLIVFFSNLFIVLILTHLFVRGLSTLPSGHIFSFTLVSFTLFLLTYIIVLSPLLNEKHKSFISLTLSSE